ncbi:hypothetical protein F5883DRAFT_653356 [Diaporthe sp. PMI_573]|nr:hypothetical protein F5883DRAFT_653356 [Diaporthaceae sp. PMI_573]
MTIKQSTRANSLECFGNPDDVYFPLTPPPGESLVRVAQSSSASCETTAPSVSESQDEKSSDESCGTTAPSSPTAGREEPSDEDPRLSELSLGEHGMEPRPSDSAGNPMIGVPQVAIIPTPPLVSIIEKLTPPRIVTVGRAIRTTAVQVELNQDFFGPFSRNPLRMNVGLRDSDTEADVDHALKGQKSFQSTLPVIGRGHNGVWVLKFVFFTHSMRVKNKGSYRFFYSIQLPNTWGFSETSNLQSSGFVTSGRSDFTCDQMEFIEEHERQDHLRLREYGDLDIVATRSG